MSDPQPITGGCLCGAVRFALRPPVLYCSHCHCHWCRRAHGAAFVTWLSVPDEAFKLTQGTDRLVWYASSAQSSRGFCSRCGTTFLFRSGLVPGQIDVTLANVDGPIDLAPQFHVFFDAHVPWVSLGDDLPRLGREDEALKTFRAVPERPPGE